VSVEKGMEKLKANDFCADIYLVPGEITRGSSKILSVKSECRTHNDELNSGLNCVFPQN